MEENRGMWKLANAKMLQHNFAKQGGIHAIAAGMHYSPTDLSEIMWQTLKDKEALGREWAPFIKNLNKRKNDWDHAAKNSEETYDFLKRYIYDE